MRFLTKEEAAELAKRHLDPNGRLIVRKDNEPVRREAFEDLSGYQYFARAQEIVEALAWFDWCLLWVVEAGVWSSNENLHLYYRLRESYGERSHLHERPAILALKHEHVDLTSFLHLGMLFGWEMFLVTSHDYGRAFISHDGFFELSPGTPRPPDESA